MSALRSSEFLASAPAGARRHVDDLLYGARQLARRFRRRRATDSQVVGGTGHGSVGVKGSGTGRRGYPPTGVEEQIAWLHEQLLALETRVATDEQALRQERHHRRTALGELETHLRNRLAELERVVAEEHQLAAEWQARGIPLLAAGVVLGAIPDVIAGLPTLVGWLILALAVVFPVIAARRRRQQIAG